jgi:hypothetical protein
MGLRWSFRQTPETTTGYHPQSLRDWNPANKYYAEPLGLLPGALWNPNLYAITHAAHETPSGVTCL